MYKAITFLRGASPKFCKSQPCIPSQLTTISLTQRHTSRKPSPPKQWKSCSPVCRAQSVPRWQVMAERPLPAPCHSVRTALPRPRSAALPPAFLRAKKKRLVVASGPGNPRSPRPHRPASSPAPASGLLRRMDSLRRAATGAAAQARATPATQHRRTSALHAPPRCRDAPGPARWPERSPWAPWGHRAPGICDTNKLQALRQLLGSVH